MQIVDRLKLYLSITSADTCDCAKQPLIKEVSALWVTITDGKWSFLGGGNKFSLVWLGVEIAFSDRLPRLGNNAKEVKPLPPVMQFDGAHTVPPCDPFSIHGIFYQ